MELSLSLNAVWKSNPRRTWISGEWLTGVGPQTRIKGSQSTAHPSAPHCALGPHKAIVLPLEIDIHTLLKKFSLIIFRQGIIYRG